MLSAADGVAASSPSQRVPYSTPIHKRPGSAAPRRPSTVGGVATLPVTPRPPLSAGGRRVGRPGTRDRPPPRGDEPEAGLTPSEAEWSDAAGFVVSSLLERGRTPRAGSRPESAGTGGFVNLTEALLQVSPPSHPLRIRDSRGAHQPSRVRHL